MLGRIACAFAIAALFSSPSFADQSPVRSSAAVLGPKQSLNTDILTQKSSVATSSSTSVADPDREIVLRWNRIAIDATGLDHTPVELDKDRVYGEQVGPGRASRAMAIVHVAMFEAFNSISGGYKTYLGMPRVGQGPAVKAAVAQAAHDTLVALYPSQRRTFDAALISDLMQVRNMKSLAQGMALGMMAARNILTRSNNDGSAHAEPLLDIDFFPSLDAGKWRQDPVSLAPVAMGAHWGQVRPFVLKSGSQFRAPAPPVMESEEYALAYEEVLRLGGDGITTPTQRTEDQTFAGIFWAYDGTPSLCAPPRLYNQLVTTIANQKGTKALELARLLAISNVAMSDAAVSVWESKFHYQMWRPVTGVREADEGMGPLGLGDGNPQTIADPNFMPLGAPATNLRGPNFTPPFPTYPSGHAGIGGALFQTLRRFYGTDNIAFTLVSDEFNGETRDHTGTVRPLRPRSFTSLSQAEEENARSRIYLGIHWSFDASEGLTQGQQIGDYVFDRLFVKK
jgi:hypothetical protein